MILEMQHVFKNYIQGEMEVPVLKDINFSVDEGEYIAITGPSGSGKTTMMNLIGCLDVATKGKVIFDGDDVGIFDDNRLSELRLRKIGFVFQHSELLGSMTAIKNVMLPLMYAAARGAGEGSAWPRGFKRPAAFSSESAFGRAETARGSSPGNHQPSEDPVGG